MDTKNINKSMEEAQRSAFLQDAWRRFAEHSETLDDLNLIADSIRKGEDLLESHEVLNRKWDEILNRDTPFEPGELKKYKKKLRLMHDELKRRQKIRMTSVHSPTIVPFRKIWYAAAAAVLLGLLIPAVRLFVKTTTEQAEIIVQYLEETTGRGEIKTFLLPDQTKVTLNVESRLRYPDVFAGERMVELQGGAIFDVTHDNDRQFTVATDNMTVKVLGTVFDVNAYPEDRLAMVSVASGKVEVETGGAPSVQATMGDAPLSATIQLEKNQQLKFEKATGNLEKLNVEAEEILSWTDGILVFSRTPIKEVVNMLNRSCPQLVFELAEGEYPNLITGKLNINRLETLLDIYIQSIGLNYRKTGNNVTLYISNPLNDKKK